MSEALSTTIFTWMLGISAIMLVAAVVLTGIRIIRGPHVADRVVALDMLCLLGVGAAAMAALVSRAIAFVDIALGLALIGFIATVAFAAFIERDVIREDDPPENEIDQKGAP